MSSHDPDISSYDRFLVAMSGGKDSLACLLHLLERDIAPERIELHHHDVDGGRPFMDWPCTPAYCQALAAHFGLPLYRSWREGGFLTEMERFNASTAAVVFELPDGGLGRSGGNGPCNTRGRFPQVAASLSVRWCSAVTKTDVMDATIRGQERFYEGQTLVVTGERAEESPGRATYRRFEPHRTATKGGRRPARYVDHWRPVHQWSEAEVWNVIARFAIRPHPAYRLGWSRLSCLSCIFGSPAQWATIQHLYPAHFERIAQREHASGLTIQRFASVRELAAAAQPYPAALAQPELARLAAQENWDEPILQRPWKLPAGAFGEHAGPT